MSYIRKELDDSVNELFSRLGDLNMTLKHLMNSDCKESFEVWLEKCIQIDKRSTFLYLRESKEKIKEEWKGSLNFHFPEELYGKF